MAIFYRSFGRRIDSVRCRNLACNQQSNWISGGRSMSDYISRRAAIDAVFSLCEDCDSGYCGSCRVNYPGGKDVIKVIRNLLNWRRRER